MDFKNSYPPKTAEEASGRSSARRLHNKLLAIRNGKQGYWCRPNTVNKELLTLLSEVIINLAFAAERGALNSASRRVLEKLSRSEIMCWLFEEARYMFQLNKEQYGDNPEGKLMVKRAGSGHTRDHTNLDHIRRLTREEITEKYGAEDWYSRYRPYDNNYISDVSYAHFLREHGLSHRYGGDVTEADLPTVDISTLSGSDPIERRMAMLRYHCRSLND